ncbi:MAG: CheY-like chemotaxis protein [Myxococcota bacterium]|jgi:CheY-like chemotaxis protein
MDFPDPPRLLVIDDEDAILETMSFTFMDDYEVITTTDARRGLEILEEQAPISVVMTDQRMPHMTGVEFLREVYKSHPDTVRIMLTGFADSKATIQAINDGHIYAYLDKPWEPAELKQTVKNAMEHYTLTVQNRKLVEDLGRGNLFLEAVMDRFESGAIAIDANGLIQAINQPARKYLRIEDSPVGRDIGEILIAQGLENIAQAVAGVSEEKGGSFEDLEVMIAGAAHRLRISSQVLENSNDERLGRVLFVKEISHEPLRRSFEESVVALSQQEGELRGEMSRLLDDLAKLALQVAGSGITSPSMSLLSERVTRTQTAIQSWIEIDDLMCREDYPDAQMLVERMRLANKRWPHDVKIPDRVSDLGQRVESYYESGENPKQRVL